MYLKEWKANTTKTLKSKTHEKEMRDWTVVCAALSIISPAMTIVDIVQIALIIVPKNKVVTIPSCKVDDNKVQSF